MPILLQETRVVAGEEFTCALRPDGVVWCWGDDSVGQLGARGVGPAPVAVAGLDQTTQACAAAGFACARRRDGTAWCWGDNRLGQLGRAERAVGLAAAPVPDLHGVAEVACSDWHACARLEDGTVWCWGAVAFGERGYVPNDRTRIDPPMRVPRVRDSLRVMSSDRFTFSIDRAGGVQRWPTFDASNVLGGSAVLSSYRGITPLRFVYKVHEFGPDHRTAFWVGRDGSLQGGPLDSPRPEPLRDVSMLASYGRWSDRFQLCALRADGSLWCRDIVFLLFEPQPGFRVVDGVAGAVDLASGARHLCYAARDGGVSCRGDNALGQVDGTRLPRADFVPVRGLPPPGDAIDEGPGSTPTAFRCPPGDRVVYVEGCDDIERNRTCDRATTLPFDRDLFYCTCDGRLAMSPRTELLVTQPITFGSEFNVRTSRVELRCERSATPVTCGPYFPLDGEVCGGEDRRAHVWCDGSGTTCQHSAQGSRFCECTAAGRWRCEVSPSLPRGLRLLPGRSSMAGTACVRAGP